jgi:uncharacterized protein
VKIEFDSAKAARNPIVHDGVTFEQAADALLDPYALTREDDDAVDEQRFVTLGKGKQAKLFVVIWTLRGETVRLISAWKATSLQRKRYERQFV